MGEFKRNIIFIGMLTILFSCKKNIKDGYSGELQVERFVGKYHMYDPISEDYYEMIISYIGPSEIYFSADDIEIKNYGNMFNLNYAKGVSLDPSELEGTIVNPIYDLDSNRWAFNNVGGSINPQYNRLIGDSLYIHFEVSNIAYYADDGVPYEAYETGHYGVKVH